MIDKARNFVKRLARDQKGLTAVEYAVLGAVVVAAIALVGGDFTTALRAAFTAMFNEVN
ncbi:Flp family type IVb pilin [Sphingobium sp. ZW T5_29]|uniref:Flp family type IVb pilin n=1 Tax=Sphingobium sp. ZW T5_29 TaxID=3378077 RepID=UPI003851C8C4